MIYKIIWLQRKRALHNRNIKICFAYSALGSFSVGLLDAFGGDRLSVSPPSAVFSELVVVVEVVDDEAWLIDGSLGDVVELLLLRIFSSNQLYPGNSWQILVKVSFCSPNSRNLLTIGSASVKRKIYV